MLAPLRFFGLAVAVAGAAAWASVYTCCGGLWFVRVPLVGTLAPKVGAAVLSAGFVLLALAAAGARVSFWAWGALRRRTQSRTRAGAGAAAAAFAAALAAAAGAGRGGAVGAPWAALGAEVLAWAQAEARVRGWALPGELTAQHRAQG